jgi:hypothetical protein
VAQYAGEVALYGGEVAQLNGSAPDCKSVVLGSNPAPTQHTANSVHPEVGSHLGLHSTVCCPLRSGRGTQYTQKILKVYRKKKL